MRYSRAPVEECPSARIDKETGKATLVLTPKRGNPVTASSSTSTSTATKSAPKEAPEKPKKAKETKTTETFDPEGPIWDDCNEVRRKIRAHISSGVKITHFLRDLGDINNNTYRTFMGYKLPDQGIENRLYKAAYYFFEEKRINEGKPKSKKRKDNEAAGGLKVTKTARKFWHY